jgi:CRP/FNR family transcriptional regulator, cyclic AMP receptor protein
VASNSALNVAPAKRPSRRSRSKDVFDLQAFLTMVGDGHSITKYGERQAVFAQGDSADSLFYIHRGKVKISVVSDQGKEAVIAILGQGHFFGEG